MTKMSEATIRHHFTALPSVSVLTSATVRDECIDGRGKSGKLLGSASLSLGTGFVQRLRAVSETTSVIITPRDCSPQARCG